MTRKIFQNKLLFEQFLSDEKLLLDFVDGVSYEWTHPNQIAQICRYSNGSIKLTLNLNVYDDDMFGCEKNSVILSLRYRSYVVLAFLYELVLIHDPNMDSYYRGLLAIHVLNALSNCKKIEVYSPICTTRYRKMNLLDIHCSLVAINRLLIEYDNYLSEFQKINVNRIRDGLIAYSSLPEIEYVKRKPVYSIMKELNMMPRLNDTFKDRIKTSKDVDINNLGDLDVREFVKQCCKTGNPFWKGAAMRLLLFSNQEIATIQDCVEDLEGCVNDFRQSCINYFKVLKESNEQYLIENFYAIKNLAWLMEGKFKDYLCDTGVLHYYK